jgi:hypothetical protein
MRNKNQFLSHITAAAAAADIAKESIFFHVYKIYFMPCTRTPLLSVAYDTKRTHVNFLFDLAVSPRNVTPLVRRLEINFSFLLCCCGCCDYYVRYNKHAFSCQRGENNFFMGL